MTKNDADGVLRDILRHEKHLEAFSVWLDAVRDDIHGQGNPWRDEFFVALPKSIAKEAEIAQLEELKSQLTLLSEQGRG